MCVRVRVRVRPVPWRFRPGPRAGPRGSPVHGGGRTGPDSPCLGPCRLRSQGSRPGAAEEAGRLNPAPGKGQGTWWTAPLLSTRSPASPPHPTDSAGPGWPRGGQQMDGDRGSGASAVEATQRLGPNLPP